MIELGRGEFPFAFSFIAFPNARLEVGCVPGVRAKFMTELRDCC